MALSVFTDENKPPRDLDLRNNLKDLYETWTELKKYVVINYPQAIEQWKYGGLKYGWNLRIRDKKRVIIYLAPCEGYFRTSFVFGEKATNEARRSNISATILESIESATVYAEGRGFRIDINDPGLQSDIEKLILIKLKY
jgi:hypothetical protein